MRVNFVDAYARLIAMKLFSQRSVDYFRSASLDDRRYLLFNPMTKAKVTMEGETVLRALHDVIAAKGYEKNTMFREVAQLIGTLPRLEGTVHVNVGLVLKFMDVVMICSRVIGISLQHAFQNAKDFQRVLGGLAVIGPQRPWGGNTAS